MTLPILDPIYTTKPCDWSFSRIQQLKGKEELPAFPPAWKNPLAKHLAPRDQQDRGTCTGQATAYCADLLYMKLTGDIPTDTDKSTFKKNVIDAIGTLHDVLYKISLSCEGAYQKGREEGNITYPSGGEIRFNCRAWVKWGNVLESHWHTDKTGHMVWMLPPGARVTPDGGISPADADAFAAQHRAEGWAQVGTPGGNMTWDQLCSAIYEKGFVLAAIPIYENYQSMQGGDGSFPDPRGELAGFHAMCFYGYDQHTIYLLHSWGDWCGMYGSLSDNFFRTAIDYIQGFVILDSTETKIAREGFSSLTITTNIPAMITVDGVAIGNSPQKIAREIGKKYTVCAEADGYEKQCQVVDESTAPELLLVLEPLVPIPPVKKGFWESFFEFILSIFRRN